MSAIKKRIILIDDHEIVQAGLSSVINAEEDMEVIDQKSNAQTGLQSIVSNSPDVVVVDINMPGTCTFDMATQALAANPNLKVIFLTAYDSDSNVERAIQSGASAFITKSESLATIVNAIREVLKGNAPFFSPDIKQRLVTSVRQTNTSIDAAPLNATITARKSLLSPRECEILCCVAKGQSARKIAAMLKISAKTVERHKSNIMTKLRMHTQVELTRYAIREGMIAP